MVEDQFITLYFIICFNLYYGTKILADSFNKFSHVSKVQDSHQLIVSLIIT